MFQLCRACQRHIKSATCPFCGSVEVAAVSRKPIDAGTISRAQLMGAVAVAGAFAVAACGDDETRVPFYGAPPVDTASSSSGSSGNFAPPYGSPPEDDGGGSSSGTVPEDAGPDADPADAADATPRDAQ